MYIIQGTYKRTLTVFGRLEASQHFQMGGKQRSVVLHYQLNIAVGHQCDE